MRRVLEQVVQHLVRVGVALDLDVDAHAVAVGLVAQVGDAVDLLVLDEVGDLLEQASPCSPGTGSSVTMIAVRSAADLLERDLGTHDDPAAAVGVHLADRVDGLPLAGDQRCAGCSIAEDRAAGREVGAGDQGSHRSSVVIVRIVDERDRRVARSRPGGGAGCWWPCRRRCPCEPLMSRFGSLAGRTVGSFWVPS